MAGGILSGGPLGLKIALPLLPLPEECCQTMSGDDLSVFAFGQIRCFIEGKWANTIIT